jgi:hypothetical protein
MYEGLKSLTRWPRFQTNVRTAINNGKVEENWVMYEGLKSLTRWPRFQTNVRTAINNGKVEENWVMSHDFRCALVSQLTLWAIQKTSPIELHTRHIHIELDLYLHGGTRELEARNMWSCFSRSRLRCCRLLLSRSNRSMRPFDAPLDKSIFSLSSSLLSDHIASNTTFSRETFTKSCTASNVMGHNITNRIVLVLNTVQTRDCSFGTTHVNTDKY